MSVRTAQEAFWEGQFGDEYAERNHGEQWVAANTALFAKALGRSSGIGSALEFGPNIGLNLMALRRLFPSAQLSAVEINARAAAAVRAALPDVDVRLMSFAEFEPDRQWDLVLTKGVLIHLNPAQLERVYCSMYAASARFIFLSEYYSPKPVSIPYRGHTDQLFKRDFAGELLDRFADLRLVDYGFAYHRDVNFPQDDETWFLLEKCR